MPAPTITLYIVYGSTGEYSDRSEWNVAAYADEALARAHVEAATRWYTEHDCYKRRREHRQGQEHLANPFDPDMDVDYTGTRWAVTQVELRTELPG